MLNLLTSPDNLEFALQHQADKVDTIRGKLEKLVSRPEPPTKTVFEVEAGFVTPATSPVPCPATPTTPAMMPISDTTRDTTRVTPPSTFYSMPSTFDSMPSSFDSMPSTFDSMPSTFDSMPPTFDPIPTTPATLAFTHLNIATTTRDSLPEHVTMTSPYSRARRKWHRSKSRVKQPYIQLPASFKYPEPIDVCPTRSSRQHARHRKKSPNQGKSQQANSSLITAPQAVTQPNQMSTGNRNFEKPQNLQFCYKPNLTGPINGNLPATSIAQRPMKTEPGLQTTGTVFSTSTYHPTPNLLHTTTMLPTSNLSLTSNLLPSEEHTISDHLSGSNLVFSMPPSLSSSVAHLLPSPVSQLLTETGVKPMLEIVVGELPDFDPKLLNTTLWSEGSEDERKSQQPPASPTSLQTSWQRANSPSWQTSWQQRSGSAPSPFLQWRNAVEYTKSRRMRTKIEPCMLDLLESKYSESHFVSPAERRQLADSLGITERAVIYWYQNRRRKDIKNLNNKESP